MLLDLYHRQIYLTNYGKSGKVLYCQYLPEESLKPLMKSFPSRGGDINIELLHKFYASIVKELRIWYIGFILETPGAFNKGEPSCAILCSTSNIQNIEEFYKVSYCIFRRQRTDEKAHKNVPFSCQLQLYKISKKIKKLLKMSLFHVNFNYSEYWRRPKSSSKMSPFHLKMVNHKCIFLPITLFSATSTHFLSFWHHSPNQLQWFPCFLQNDQKIQRYIVALGELLFHKNAQSGESQVSITGLP